MKQQILTIEQNIRLSEGLFRMSLAIDPDTEKEILPGQFINIKLDGFYLRRPISVDDVQPGKLVIIYKTAGEGTAALSLKKTGEKLDVLLPLGNGFSLDEAGDKPLIIGGGVGVAPMYYTAKCLANAGKCGCAVLGFNKKEEIFLKDDFEKLGFKVIITTVDGSEGVKGFVTDAMKDLDYSYAFVCGPEPMIRAVHKTLKTSAQYSFEERMGCGFGACMGCSCKTITGYKRICKDGPVMRKEEVLWED